MPEYQNPAGRLHELLTRFGSMPTLSVQAAWAEVLDVAPEEVPLYLGDVASLLRDVRDAARETGMDAFEPIADSLTTLSRSVFPIRVSFSNAASDVTPDPTAMAMVKMLSAYLQRTASEGKIPDDTEVQDLRLAFAELIEVVGAAGLPPDIERALLRRLNAIVTALEHLNVGGPDAVRRAAEALAISAVLYERDAGGASEVFERLRSAAQKTWLAFTVVTTLANAVITFDRLAGTHVLPPPAQEQKQLPPPDSPPGHDHVTGLHSEQI